jgi:hypothetical protein
MKQLGLNGLLISFLFLVSCSDADHESNTEVNNAEIQEVKSDETTGEVAYLDLGMKYVQQTQQVLAKNLVHQINTNGTVKAFSYCSAEAYPLTDSMATALNAQIKRVSDQPRNPANRANEKEANYIENAKETLLAGGKIKPEVHEMDDKMVGYYPILTNGLCMQCHGNKTTQISSETMAAIQETYPEDKAIGYLVNELRGIWVVEMNKQ